MLEQAPNLDSAWRLLLSFIPQGLRPLAGILATLVILAWVFLNGLKLLLEVGRNWREFSKSRSRDQSRTTDLPPLPPPRVSIWSQPVRDPPRPRLVRDNGIPIVTFANMKGGVGKTTLTANYAAHLDKSGKRVLLIDLDYQGSLSQTALAAANNPRIGSSVDDLIRNGKPIGAILEASQTLTPALPNSRILTCYYEFADTETHEMVDWIVAVREGRNTDDARFRLTTLLSDDIVRSSFDIVLIDAPPRFSTGTINALCASTHLVIPTVLDQMSAEAVNYFSRDVAAMRAYLFPNLLLAGVVPTLTWRATEFSQREAKTIELLNTLLRPHWGANKTVLENAFVPRKQSIGDTAGEGIAYVDAGQRRQTTEVRAIFDRVGGELTRRIWP